MSTIKEYSVLAARSMPLSGAVNWWRPAEEDIEDGFVSVPARMPAFAWWMPTL